MSLPLVSAMNGLEPCLPTIPSFLRSRSVIFLGHVGINNIFAVGWGGHGVADGHVLPKRRHHRR